MSAVPIIGRTVAKNMTRPRTYMFLLIFAALSVLFVAAPLEIHDFETDRDLETFSETPKGQEDRAVAEQRYEDQRGNYTAQVSWSAMNRVPILNIHLVLILFSVLVTSHAVAGEWQDRTLFLLLSKPISKTGFMTAKFVGAFLVQGIAWLVIVLAHVITGLVEGQEGVMSGAFLVQSLSMLAFLAVSTCMTGALAVMLRQQTGTIAAALGIFIFVAPLVGSIGFASSYADKEFRELGQDDEKNVILNCGSSHRFYDFDGKTSAQAAQYFESESAWIDSYDACQSEMNADTNKFYTDRDAPVFDFNVGYQRCELRDAYHNYNVSQSGEGEYQSSHCWSETLTDDEYDERAEAYATKYDVARADWSRYFDSKGMLVWGEGWSGFNSRTDGQEWSDLLIPGLAGAILYEEAAGIDPVPAHAWVSVLAVFGQIAVFFGLAALVLHKRDLS